MYLSGGDRPRSASGIAGKRAASSVLALSRGVPTSHPCSHGQHHPQLVTQWQILFHTRNYASRHPHSKPLLRSTPSQSIVFFTDIFITDRRPRQCGGKAHTIIPRLSRPTLAAQAHITSLAITEPYSSLLTQPDATLFDGSDLLDWPLKLDRSCSDSALQRHPPRRRRLVLIRLVSRLLLPALELSGEKAQPPLAPASPAQLFLPPHYTHSHTHPPICACAMISACPSQPEDALQ